MRFLIAFLVASLVVSLASPVARSDDAPGLRLLFLGDSGPHRPPERAKAFIPAMDQRGITVEYTQDVPGTLSLDRLSEYDGLILYANIDEIEDDQAAALLEYVDRGGGFIPLHCASFCFRNNDDVVALIGAQFQRHGAGVFSVTPSQPGKSHPLMQGYGGFESWDETYVHTKHNEKDRTVLEVRIDDEGREPWTWIRKHGDGRVFYTAWGHDDRTWSNPGFLNLVERGIRWACGDDPSVVPPLGAKVGDDLTQLVMDPPRSDVQPFEYVDVGPKIPNYIPSKQWGQQEPPRRKMQLPLSAAESIKHFVVPTGFRVELFASEPDLGGKPICVTWDERGRLWVAESYDYPNEKQADGAGRDRIRICEDTDGDGRADQFTVFADRLSIPTSIARTHGGLIVHQAPDTLFLKDTDGDDVADVRQVLFRGWGTFDSHAGPSNLTYGPDNWFYGQVGYSGFEGEIAGKRRSFRTGFYRFKVEPNGENNVAITDFEFLRNTNNNSWGVGFSEEGLLFGSTANRNPSEFMPIANRHYERVKGWSSTVLTGIADSHRFEPITENIRQVDHHGGYTAAAGHALYTARRYPRPFWNRTAFVAGPTGHLVGIFELRRDGAMFQSSSPANLIASDDEWSAPICAEVGPDGNVWVVDWYNYIVQHNPTPVGFETGSGNAYVTDLRDKKYGRVYRVVYEDADESAESQRSSLKSLENASNHDLVRALDSDNLFWRRHAQRLLVERNAQEVVSDLVARVSSPNVDEIGLDVGAIHALRSLQGLTGFADEPSREALDTGLRHPSPGVVRTTIEVMPRDAETRDLLSNSNAFDSQDGQVRLSALLAIAEMPPSTTSTQLAIDALGRNEHQRDRWIQDAAVSAAANAGHEFVALVAASSSPSPRLASTTAIVAEHLARSEDREHLSDMIDRLDEISPAIRAAILTGWTKGWPDQASMAVTNDQQQALLRVYGLAGADQKAQLVRLARRWQNAALIEQGDQSAKELVAIAVDPTGSKIGRVQAARALVGLVEDPSYLQQLVKSLNSGTPLGTAVGIIESLKQSDSAEIGPLLVSQLDELPKPARAAAVRVLLSRVSSTLDLLDAIGSEQLARTELSLSQSQALLAHPKANIKRKAFEVLTSVGSVPDSDRAAVLASLMDVTKTPGDVDRGRAVFEKHCSNCHAHRGKGAKIGPDLTGMGVHPKAELLTQILDPSRSVEGNYRVYSLITSDGRVLTGMVVSQTNTTIELVDSQARQVIVNTDEVDDFVASNKSVMPEGFERQIDRQGFADLLEFFTQSRSEGGPSK